MRLLVLMLLCAAAGCVMEVQVTPEPPREYYKPKVFEDGRYLINPYREPGTVGPRFPYRLVYDEESGLYRTVPAERTGAPPLDMFEPAPPIYEPPPGVVKPIPFVYEGER